MVTPCVGVWIETIVVIKQNAKVWSHPAWVCGLKHFLLEFLQPECRHTLRGCVD